MIELKVKGVPVRLTKRFSPEYRYVQLFGFDYYVYFESDDWKTIEEVEKELYDKLSTFEVYFLEPEIPEINEKLYLLGFTPSGDYPKLSIPTDNEEKVVEEILRIGLAVYPFSGEFSFFTKDKVLVPNLEKGVAKFSVIYPFAQIIPESVKFAKRIVRKITRELGDL